MASLFVLLTPTAVSATSELPYVLSADGHTEGTHSTAIASLLPAPSGPGSEVVAVVPAHALSWHQVQLPKGVAPGSPRLRAVLDGLLEEQLLDEPQNLHLAVQPQARAGEPVWVAACQRDWLRGALQILEAAGRPASRVVPELAPQAASTLHATGDAQDAWLHLCGPEGVLTLPLGPGAAAMLPPLEPDTPCLAEPAVAAQAEQLLQRPVSLQTAPARGLRAAQSDWDLAQFDLASSGGRRTARRVASAGVQLLRAPQWRPARWGAVLLVVANLLGLNAWAWKERTALEAKRMAVRDTLTQTFPSVKLVVDAPLQMEREVAALRQATGTPSGRDLEALLGALAAVAPQRSASAIEFTGSELRMRGLGLGADELRAVQPSLRGQGVAASLQGDVLVLSAEAAR